MDAPSAALSSSVAIPPQSNGGNVGPIQPKQQAEEERAEKDQVQSDERVRDAAAKSDAGPGVGLKIDIAA